MSQKQTLKRFHIDDATPEVGIDEVGRGPLFGRVYTACVVLPKDDSFDHSLMKDSKSFHSVHKIKQVSDYIKSHCVQYEISYEDHDVIDNINILQATQSAMHKGINKILSNLEEPTNVRLLVDGNYFNPYLYYDKKLTRLSQIDHVCIAGGDATYSAIAAASIVAKVARDTYILELCEEHPYLQEKYDLIHNKGYGAQKHRDGIKAFGISFWHRKTFGTCKNFI